MLALISSISLCIALISQTNNKLPNSRVTSIDENLKSIKKVKFKICKETVLNLELELLLNHFIAPKFFFGEVRLLSCHTPDYNFQNFIIMIYFSFRFRFQHFHTFHIDLLIKSFLTK